jgi:uncharacterized membrane protein (DUF485 family)
MTHMTADTPVAPPETPDAETYERVQNSAEFAGLRKALRSFVFPTTAAFLVWYGLYVVLSAYARDFMSTKVVGHINVALIFGLLQFVSTFLIAWLYARYASRKLDPVADRIRAEMEGGQS